MKMRMLSERKRFIKALSAIIALLFILCGCASAPVVTTSEVTAENFSATAETAEENDGIIRFIKDGAPAVRLVASGTGGGINDTSRELVVRLGKYLNEKTGLDFDKYRDTRKLTEEEEKMAEIVIGITNREESIEAYEALGYDDCSITVSGNKILLSAYTDDNLLKVYNAFITRISKAQKEHGEYCFSEEQTVVSTPKNASGELPKYTSGKYAGIYDAGGKTELLLVKATDKDEFMEYLELLEKSGFEKYSVREVNGNVFSIYNSEKYTVNAGFYDYEDSARILIEPLAPLTGLEEDDKDHKKICEPMITMLGLDTEDGSNANGLSVLIRLEDGRFIIFDGGHNSSTNSINLLEEMKRQSADYVSSEDKITVAAWVVTHVHGDHSGMMTHNMGRFSGINIEKVLMNTISREALDAAKASNEYKDNFDAGEGTGDTSLMNTLNKAGIEYRRVHTGQVFFMGGAKMEILYTLDSFTPKLLNAFNTTSLVVGLEIAGQKIIITGDATGDAMQICANMYGDYLKCDIASVAHHGYSTWGNNQGMINAYNLMRPAVVLWCQGSKAYPSYKDKVYNKPLFESEEYREVFVAGFRGEFHRLTLPYTPNEQKAAA